MKPDKRWYDTHDPDVFWRTFLTLCAIALGAALMAGCGASPTAPREPVCTTVHHPAVTRTILVCTGSVCRPHEVVITPAWTEQVCQ